MNPLGPIVLVLFFLSGAAGLVYEALWTRQLSLVFGVTTYAVSTVLATFMGGLALGSWLIGRAVDRRRNPLLVYALLEAGIGLYALAIPTAFALLRPAYVGLHRLGLSYALFSAGRALLVGARIERSKALGFPVRWYTEAEWRQMRRDGRARADAR